MVKRLPTPGLKDCSTLFLHTCSCGCHLGITRWTNLRHGAVALLLNFKKVFNTRPPGAIYGISFAKEDIQGSFPMGTTGNGIPTLILTVGMHLPEFQQNTGRIQSF